MPQGVFVHKNIASSQSIPAECFVGWIAHYMIGISLALGFVILVGESWLKNPTVIPAVTFGIVSVVAPLFVMQPCFGLGIAASKTPKPSQARLRSLMNHTAFGVGLYIFALLANLMNL